MLQSPKNQVKHAYRKHTYFLVITLTLSGFIWGSAAIFIFPYDSVVHQAFIAFILGGMIAGSVGIFSILKTAFYVYSIPAILPIIIIFFRMNDEIHYAMGTMSALFWLIMFVTVRRLNVDILKSMNLKYENIDLISDLEKEINERKSAEEKLLKKNQEIELIVQNRTSQLQNTNNRLIREIEERKQIENKLKESQKKHRDLANSLPQIVFECDQNGLLTFANINGANLYGYTLEDFYKGVYIFDMIAPEDRKRVQENFKKVLNKEDIGGIEYIALRADGTRFPVVYHANPIIRDNTAVGMRGLGIDLTEQKRVEEERNKLEAQLQRAQKMEAIGTLAGGVAHDLNNILSGIVSYPDLLLMQLPDGSPLRTPILTMQKSGNKAAAIVQDLLTLTRRGVLNKEVVDLNNIISEYLSSPEYKKMMSFHSRIRVDVDLARDLFKILGSPIHLTKTIMNLISNAAEAMPDGGRITISTINRYIDKPIRGYDDIEEGDYVVLIVSDTGVGIAVQDLERIFEPFFTKKVMGRSGTGLGMAVVWGTVKDLNGYIDVHSNEGEGSKFTLYFPATRISAPERKSLIAIEAFRGHGESILLVDDIKEQREIASAILTQIGYSVTTVSCGEEAIEYLKKNKVDLLVLDMIMDPGIDGLDTYKKILEINPNQKAIISSGFSETERVKEAQKLGAGIYLKKPYTMEKIAEAVREALEG